mmetsp:Transcript_26598/g.79030  ORF Transcript_26598/g.79030 Transcript_26598/m.79030 type:complete len:350 (+) Transcript_26598:1719-2768(+)
MACLSERSLASWRSSDSSAPLPNGLVIDAWNASVGNSRDRWCSQRLVTQLGTRSHLLSSSSRCLWRRCLRMCCSRKPQRVPIGSRASSTWITTSDESSTLYSSPQMRFDCPFMNGASLTRLRYRKPSPSSGASNIPDFSEDFSARPAMLSTASVGRLRFLPLPNVSEKGCVASRFARSCFPPVFFSGSSSNCIGSFFSRSSTEYASFTLLDISLRNWSNCFWPITRVLPNQRLSGWMRVVGRSLDCSSSRMSLPLLSRTARVLYMLSRLTVAASRMPFSPLLGRLASLLCFGLRLSSKPPGDFALAPPLAPPLTPPFLVMLVLAAARSQRVCAMSGCAAFPRHLDKRRS